MCERDEAFFRNKLIYMSNNSALCLGYVYYTKAFAELLLSLLFMEQGHLLQTTRSMCAQGVESVHEFSFSIRAYVCLWRTLMEELVMMDAVEGRHRHLLGECYLHNELRQLTFQFRKILKGETTSVPDSL